MNIKTLLISEVKTPYSALVIGCFEEDKHLLKQLFVLGKEPAELFRRLNDEKIFQGKTKEVFSSLLSKNEVASGLIFLGLGKRGKLTTKTLRDVSAHLIPEIKRLKAQKAAVLLPVFEDKNLSLENAAQAITESVILSNYRFDRYHEKKESNGPKRSPVEIDFLVLKFSEKNHAEKGMLAGSAIAESVNFARDLGNEPANMMTPSQMVKEARKIADETGLKIDVLEEQDLKKLKMGGILGVAQGSHESPYLIVLEKHVKHPKRTVCLVGKGITFDTGGISLKPSRDMEKMKYDMMGAAAVIAAMRVISGLNIPIRVIGVTPVCENLPSQKPQRPGDIVTAFNKKTVEVINTDAEGRLILMDAIAYCEKFKPDAIIDIATLTGACAATFSDKCIGLMGNNKKLVERLLEAGIKSGERCWELPMFDEYLDMIKGDVADLKNVGPGVAGTITAGKFLEQFVPKDVSWAHLDIAGVAWADSPKPFTPKGPTGAGVRLLTQFISDWK